MGKTSNIIFLRKINNVKVVCIILSLFYIFSCFSSDDLDLARDLFVKGNYKEAIEQASKYKSIEALVLQSRILSIYTHFHLKDRDAEEKFLKSYEIAKSAIQIDPDNDEAYVEAAHSLGRYGQKIGIMSAISKGIASRVKKYLDKALEINPNNILANLSKGIWHAEIINQAGKAIASTVYGANIDKALIHFEKVKKHKNSNEIGVLYELAYGYYLLSNNVYTEEAKSLIESLLKKIPFSDMDKIYIKKARNLLKILT